ncbi:hypothetical protein LJR225_000727 [Phenylobacterium sp. LjRoot225]|uniref:hypothetical protein n=1 Tax=Phenylobacterium sp. LjRoot225 TaxID=3342285 RepID=UPI003ECF1B25
MAAQAQEADGGHACRDDDADPLAGADRIDGFDRASVGEAVAAQVGERGAMLGNGQLADVAPRSFHGHVHALEQGRGAPQHAIAEVEVRPDQERARRQGRGSRPRRFELIDLNRWGSTGSQHRASLVRASVIALSFETCLEPTRSNER